MTGGSTFPDPGLVWVEGQPLCVYCRRQVLAINDRGGRLRAFNPDPVPADQDVYRAGWLVRRRHLPNWRTTGAPVVSVLVAIPSVDLPDQVLAEVVEVLLLHTCREEAEARYTAQAADLGLGRVLERIFGGLR